MRSEIWDLSIQKTYSKRTQSQRINKIKKEAKQALNDENIFKLAAGLITGSKEVEFLFVNSSNKLSNIMRTKYENDLLDIKHTQSKIYRDWYAICKTKQSNEAIKRSLH